MKMPILQFNMTIQCSLSAILHQRYLIYDVVLSLLLTVSRREIILQRLWTIIEYRVMSGAINITSNKENIVKLFSIAFDYLLFLRLLYHHIIILIIKPSNQKVNRIKMHIMKLAIGKL